MSAEQSDMHPRDGTTQQLGDVAPWLGRMSRLKGVRRFNRHSCTLPNLSSYGLSILWNVMDIYESVALKAFP